MNSKLFAILLSGLASILLTISGGYLVIENLVQPQGYLFEGIVLASIGLLIGLMILIAISIGETIMIFGQIMEQQVKIQKEMREMSERASSGPDLGSILKRIMPGSISITDLDTGKTTGNIPAVDLDTIRNLMTGGKKLGIEDMGLQELEDELANAIKKDDYERADKISKAIKQFKDSNNNESENND